MRTAAAANLFFFYSLDRTSKRNGRLNRRQASCGVRSSRSATAKTACDRRDFVPFASPCHRQWHMPDCCVRGWRWQWAWRTDLHTWHNNRLNEWWSFRSTENEQKQFNFLRFRFNQPGKWIKSFDNNFLLFADFFAASVEIIFFNVCFSFHLFLLVTSLVSLEWDEKSMFIFDLNLFNWKSFHFFLIFSFSLLVNFVCVDIFVSEIAMNYIKLFFCFLRNDLSLFVCWTTHAA